MATSRKKLKRRDTDSSSMHAFMMLIHPSTIIGQSSKSVYKLNISKMCKTVNFDKKKKPLYIIINSPSFN